MRDKRDTRKRDLMIPSRRLTSGCLRDHKLRNVYGRLWERSHPALDLAARE